MNELERALVDVAEFLDQAGLSYMVIGGFANLHWGAPRLTEDLDITVRVAESALSDFVSSVAGRFSLEDPSGFARHHGVIPIRTAGGIRVDLILEGHPLVSRAIDRAVTVEVGGRAIRFCTAEDLILQKLVSERPRDQEDVEGIVIRQAGSLERSYLDPLVEQLSAALERPAISKYYRACLSKAGVEPARNPGAPRASGRRSPRPRPGRRTKGRSNG